MSVIETPPANRLTVQTQVLEYKPAAVTDAILRELDRGGLDFTEGRADVLVATMIIESGIDIPTVNTLIVDRADALGLAQLYQLRGRVGRRAHRAYAYLMVPSR